MYTEHSKAHIHILILPISFIINKININENFSFLVILIIYVSFKCCFAVTYRS
jgi:hypothetical protein